MTAYKIQLLPEETVLWEARPLEAIKSYDFVVWMLVWSFILACTLVGILFIPLVAVLMLWFVQKTYEQSYYWVTNKRVIYRRGILGYKISSIPLNRISDVIISHTFLEQTFHFGSLQIQTLAGQVSSASGGAEANLRAIQSPERVQRIILEAIKHQAV